MKKLLLKLTGAALGLFMASSAMAQAVDKTEASTAGTFTFTYTPIKPTSGFYSGSQYVLAVWIENNSGTFVRTFFRYCCNGSTFDHLPTWSVNAGGTSGNCSSANTTGATTGATQTNWTSARTFTWNGTDKTGTLLADGTYKVMIQETWGHGSATTTSTYTFTKGATAATITPAADTHFKNITGTWTPSGTTGISQSTANMIEGVSIYPNPSAGIFNVNFEKATDLKVINTIGVVVYDEKIEQGTQNKNVDLSSLSNGIYFVYIADGDRSSKYKIILNK